MAKNLLQGGKAKFAGSKTCGFWGCEWKYGSKFEPHMYSSVSNNCVGWNKCAGWNFHPKSINVQAGIIVLVGKILNI